MIYKITGMDCDSCAKMIELDLEDVGHQCKCSYTTQTLEINEPHDKKKVMDIVKKAGYTLIVNK